MKNLYCAPVGAAGKDFLVKTIERFGTARFEYLIWCWDQTRFTEKIFANCRILHQPGVKWDFMRQLHPDTARHYETIWCWDDDIDLLDFDPLRFLRIFRHNRLDMAQPALSPDSYYTHTITLCQPGPGRLTDFVEIMVPVFRGDAWGKWWAMMVPDNGWGWGYDLLANGLLGFRMGIIDAQPVRHTREASSTMISTATYEKCKAAENAFLRQHWNCRSSRLGPELVGSTLSPLADPPSSGVRAARPLGDAASGGRAARTPGDDAAASLLT